MKERIMKKIAIPTRNNVIDDHFGHCEYYTIFTVNDDKKIIDTEIYEAPKGCGCKSNVSVVLKEKGVDVLLAGNMGRGAVNVIQQQQIQVFRGCTGDVTKVAETYLRGFIIDSGLLCNHHDDDGHSCGNH